MIHLDQQLRPSMIHDIMTHDEHWHHWNITATHCTTSIVVTWYWNCPDCGKQNVTKRDRGNTLDKSKRTTAGDDYDILVRVRCGKCHGITRLLHWPKPRRD
jgi:hypothetical protein